MPIGCLQILMFKEGGRGQNNVCVVRGVREELLMDYGEQVRPLQAANHVVVVRTYRRRIRVVNEQSLDRRIIEGVERLAQFHHVHHPSIAPERNLHQVRTL